MLQACSALLALALFILAAPIKQIVAVACSVTSLITPAKRSTQLSAMSAVRMKIVLQLNTATQPPQSALLVRQQEQPARRLKNARPISTARHYSVPTDKPMITLGVIPTLTVVQATAILELALPS